MLGERRFVFIWISNIVSATLFWAIAQSLTFWDSSLTHYFRNLNIDVIFGRPAKLLYRWDNSFARLPMMAYVYCIWANFRVVLNSDIDEWVCSEVYKWFVKSFDHKYHISSMKGYEWTYFSLIFASKSFEPWRTIFPDKPWEV